jgi:hypothetical protein
MLMQNKGGCVHLSDKDLQLVRKTYCKLTELYYENTGSDAMVADLICLGNLITQTVPTGRQVSVLSILPIIEPLKIKSKSRPELLAHIDQVIAHLKSPAPATIQ